MNYDNLAIIAAAGSGKTTFIVDEITKIKEDKILLVTYTNANIDKLKYDIRQKIGTIPSNIDIMTWERFLLYHCIRPYRSSVWNHRIEKIDYSHEPNRYVKETNIERFYFVTPTILYGKRATKFALKCNEASNNGVIERLQEIYKHIYMDEVQDMSGEDIDLIGLLLESNIHITMVGDIRQSIYHTCNSNKNKKYKGCNIIDKMKQWETQKLLHIEYRNYSFRCKQEICDLSDELFPDIKSKTISRNEVDCKHEGIYLIREKDLYDYVQRFNPMILRWSVKSKIPDMDETYKVRNIGESKGQSYNHVVIICTNDFAKFIEKGVYEDNKNDAKSKLYVAITRARYSVGFVTNNNSVRKGVKIYDSADKE